jgi:hypothetical protein
MIQRVDSATEVGSTVRLEIKYRLELTALPVTNRYQIMATLISVSEARE